MKYERGSRIVKAVYSKPCRVIYQGNPCIEALPEAPDDKELFKSLYTRIPIDKDFMDFPDYERKECVQDLSHVFVPIGQMCEVARKIMSAIREGYVSRNPLLNSHWREIGALQRAVINRDSSFQSISGVNANACGFCLLGDSGMGKTSIVNHTLSTIPQVIEHESYNGEDFVTTQIVWLKVECPHDASIKGLCIDFFTEYDLVVNDNTRQRFATGRTNQDDMISNMAYLARKMNLGLLVIDEIQNVSAGRSGGGQRMKNLITQLVNKIGIPVLLVGTPAAIGLLSTELITIRRGCGQLGLSYLRALDVDSMDWDTFIRCIWKYQWTKEKAERTEELTGRIHFYSKGNIDATIKLFMEAQRIAIDTGAEVISGNIIKKAANSSSFILVINRIRKEYEALQRLKNGSKGKRDVYETLTVIENGLGDYEEKSKSAKTSQAGSKMKKNLDRANMDRDMVTQDDEY